MAQNASNLTAMELRARGAHELLNKAFNERANAQYLGYFGSGYTFHTYLKSEPKRTPAGGIDFSGLKVRGATVYRPFYDRIGLNMVLIHVPEMHSALERGVIDIGWTTLAMVFKLADAAQKSWRRLNGHVHLPKIILGVKFADGIEVAVSSAAPQAQAAA
jgi:hypothetical protein